jgi:flagellar motility protein MotE (MotC chaperone)
MARMVFPLVAVALLNSVASSQASPKDAAVKQLKAAITKLKKEESAKHKAINEKYKAAFRQKLSKQQKDQLNAMKRADFKALHDSYRPRIKALEAQLKALNRRTTGGKKKGR